MKKTINSCDFILVAVAIIFSQTLPAATTNADETYDLAHEIRSGETLSIKTQIQFQGSVIVDRAGQDEDVTTLPLDVQAKAKFDQRMSDSSSSSPQAIRHYTQANATIKVGAGNTAVQLNKQNNILLARLKTQTSGNQQFQIASIAGKLSQKEYELLKNPGDPLTYASLIDKSDVSVGDSWKLTKEQLTGLLSLNRVISTSATMMLKSVDKNIAKLYIYGSIKGEIDDVITKQKIKGIVQLDIDEKRVSTLRLSIEEDRRAGQVAPGFEGKVKFDARITPADDNKLISKESLAKLHKGKKIKFNFQFDRGDNEVKFLHDTAWRIIASEDEAVVLRYLHDGQLLSQCNIVQLPARPADKPLELIAFAKEVKEIIAKSEATIVESEKIVTDNNLEALKIAVDGTESDIPFRWIYYHVSNDDGRRVTLVFTLEKESREYFKNADKALIQSISFKAKTSTAKATKLTSPAKR